MLCFRRPTMLGGSSFEGFDNRGFQIPNDELTHALSMIACAVKRSNRYPALKALSARCEARPEFRATRPDDYVLPKGGL